MSLCQYCEKDLGPLNATNKNRHLEKCKLENPVSSKKRKKQCTIPFLPKSVRVESDLSDGDIAAGSTQDTVAGNNIVDNSEVEILETETVQSLDGDIADAVVDDDDNVANNGNGTVFAGESDDVEEVLDTIQPIASIDARCQGYDLEVERFYENFPFQLLPTLPHIIVCGSVFHHVSCANDSFHLQPDAQGNINKCCLSLKSDEKLSAIAVRGKLPVAELHGHINNVFLSHVQLNEKCTQLRKSKNLLQPDLLKKSKRVHKLNSVLGLHQRFMVLLSQNNVPRVKELISVALKCNRSINYIVDKVSAAIEGVYRARPSEEDKDLAFVVLKIGGPSLLSILCRANKLPSCSTAYRIGKQMSELECPVTMSVAACVEKNLEVPYFLTSYSSSLKMDETFLSPKLRYNAKSNCMQGICYQHAPSNLQFDTYADLETISQKIRNEECHVPKECLVVGFNRIDSKSKFNVILAWPTCAKDDYDGTFKIISTSSREYKKQTGKPLMNICTDGDAARRIVVHKYCDKTLSPLSPLYDTVSDIPLLDLSCGPYDETVSYDPKHLVKRCWCASINGTVKINGVIITNDDLRQLLLLTESNSLIVDHLVKPKDKRNVPNPTKFMLAFIKATRNESSALPYRLQGFKAELLLLSYVFEALLSFYTFTDASISTQIKSFSIGAHCLLYLYRQNKTNMLSNQLVHDIQATFQDAIFCCCKVKEYAPEEPLYLVKNGTDPEEAFFGVVRAKNKNCNLDSLEFIHCASALSQVDHIIMNKHPEWSKSSRLSKRLCLDYSGVDSWDKEKLVLLAVDIAGTFKMGKLAVSSMVSEHALKEIDFDGLADDGVTFMKPFKKIIGVDDAEVDWSMPDVRGDEMVDDEVEEQIEDGEEDINVGDYISGSGFDATVEIDGKHVYKATCIKEALYKGSSLFRTSF